MHGAKSKGLFWHCLPESKFMKRTCLAVRSSRGPSCATSSVIRKILDDFNS
ncbi:Hypothetical predicted protein [Podarcis lilfordi]|uniref:Uncharacterized protein n=1 Tax=Podarcis lilfordi TaxID=74358 RepID=A0AA35P6I1_9SAUR|nr:Hypothetical predicted protein [Podarcis lilfordi]